MELQEGNFSVKTITWSRFSIIHFLFYCLSLVKVGRWSVDMSSGKRCLSSCTRQENRVQVSRYKFPNKMFLNSKDIIKLIKKLAVACDPLIKIFGPKRPLLDAQYPQLCPFFDQVSKDDLAADVDASFTVHHFFKGLNLGSDELATLKEQLMAYASDNLVKINAFLDSPYLSKYQTDEVLLRFHSSFQSHPLSSVGDV